MFANLAEQFEGRSIEFEQLELQRWDVIVETKRRVEELGLSNLVVDKNETAFGVLLSSDGTLVTRFDPSDTYSLNQQKLLKDIEK